MKPHTEVTGQWIRENAQPVEATALHDWFGMDWSARAAEEVAHAAINNRPILDGPTFKEYSQSKNAARVALESVLARHSVEDAQSHIDTLRKELEEAKRLLGWSARELESAWGMEPVETAPRERLRRCYELAIEPDGQENQPQSENTKLRQENAELWETNRELLNAIEKVMDWWGRSATTGTEADDEMDPEVFDQAHAAIEKANALAKL